MLAKREWIATQKYHQCVSVAQENMLDHVRRKHEEVNQ